MDTGKKIGKCPDCKSDVFTDDYKHSTCGCPCCEAFMKRCGLQ